MKRSKINAIIRSTEEFLLERKFYLPPFANWSVEDWSKIDNAAIEIVQNRLGWDITDFGLGDFDRFGLFLFTLRNGDPRNPQVSKTYAEKILIVKPGQITPMHFHWKKIEDIINRGGGSLLLHLFNATPEGGLDQQKDVIASMDGVVHTVKAGGTVELKPGESITLTQYMYHEFWSPDSTVLLGEVSLVNDDEHDNRFAQPIGRFPAVEEDEAPYHLLCMDYEKFVPHIRAAASGAAI